MRKSLWVVFLSVALSAGLAHADRKAIVFPDASVHSNPDDFSQVIGTYHKRTTVTVADQPQNGWYRVVFPSAVKGFSEGWVRKDAIEGFVSGQPIRPQLKAEGRQKPEQKRRASHRSGHVKQYASYFGLFLDEYYVGPSTFQGFVGEKKENFLSMGLGGEYGFKMADVFFGYARLNYYSFSRNSVTNSVSDAYFAKGFVGMLGGDYFLTHGGSFNFGLGLGLGGALSTAGNAAPNGSGSVIQKSTSGIFSITYHLRLVAELLFGDGTFGARAELGYRGLTLSKVPVTVTGSSQDATVDLSLSAPFAGLGLYYFF